MDDLRLAWRRLLAQPAASLGSIVTLACAIGAAAASWSLLSDVLIHPLRLPDAAHLVAVGERYTTGPQAGRIYRGHLYPEYLEIRKSGIFAGLAASGATTSAVTLSSGTAQRPVALVSHDYFPVLGVAMSLGRGFSEEDDRRGAPIVAVLSDRLWQTEFQADPTLIGREIRIANKPVTVIGVAARKFRGLDLASAPDLYVPLHAIGEIGGAFNNYFAEPQHASSPSSWIRVVGRLGAGSSAAPAADQLARLRVVAPGRKPPQIVLTDLNVAAVPEAAREGLVQFSRLLGATVGLLLVIACGTVGMLLLARTEARRQEFAMCLALGASRARLARGVMAEGALLAVAGAILAVPVTQWMFAGVRLFQLPGGIDIGLLELSVDGRAFGVAGACAAGATLLIALVAGAFGFATDVADALRAGAGSTRRSGRRTRAALVAAQVAVALLLVAGAGVFTRSLIRALTVNASVDAERIVTASLPLIARGYAPARADAFVADLADRLRQHRAIAGLSFTSSRGSMSAQGTLVIDGQRREMPSAVTVTAIDDDYFRTIGVEPAAGRPIGRDDAINAPPVAIVSASLARFLANDVQAALHHRITLFSRPAAAAAFPVVEVVGVVPDVITNLASLAPFDLYLPLAQFPGGANPTIVVRAAADAGAATRALSSTIRSMDATLAPGPALSLSDRLARQMGAQLFGRFVLGALGGIAVLLALLGTYVVAESTAVQRRREMGVRAALGATRPQLARLILRETGRLVVGGLAIGLLLVWTCSGVIRAFLFRVEPLDPATLVAVSALLLGLALLVSIRPALRTARIDLASVLRGE